MICDHFDREDHTVLASMSPEQLRNLTAALALLEDVPSKHGPVKAAKIRAALVLVQQEQSLDQIIDLEASGYETAHLSALAAPDAGVEALLNRLDVEARLDALERVSAKRAAIVRAYYGIGMARSYTMQEIGDLLGVSRQAVDQQLKRGLKDLREGV